MNKQLQTNANNNTKANDNQTDETGDQTDESDEHTVDTNESHDQCAAVQTRAMVAKEGQEAQLPQRDSASAAHVFLGSLTDRALH